MAKPKRWYEFKASSDGSSAEVFIYEEIGGWGITAKDFINELKQHAGKSLTVRINSPGGEVFDGHAIYNALLRHKGGVTIQIDGLAASMASIISMSGSPIRMAKNGYLMIHNPGNFAFGDAGEMRKMADLLDKMRDGLVNVYASKTNLPAEEIESMMDDETWMTAIEALDKGFIDEITDEVQAVAKLDSAQAKRFSRVPSALVDTAPKGMATPKTKPKSKASEEELEELKARIKALEEVDEPEGEGDDDEPEGDDEPEANEDEEIKALKARVKALEDGDDPEEEDAVAKAQAQAKKNYKSFLSAKELLSTATAKLEVLNKKLATASARIVELEAEQSDFEARASIRAQQILAASGHQPLNLNPAGAGAGGNQHSNLKGRDRVAAAFNKQFSK